MRFSGLVRVGIIAALLTTFVSGLVAYYAPDVQGQISVAGRQAPAWIVWTGGLSLGAVAYVSAVFWLLFRMRRTEHDEIRVLDFSDGIRALLGAPFVVAGFPLILLGGVVAGAANHSDEIRERFRMVYDRYRMRRHRPGMSETATNPGMTSCPECGKEAANLPSAGVVNCKRCGMVSV